MMPISLPNTDEACSNIWTLIGGTLPRGTVEQQQLHMLESFRYLDAAFFRGILAYYVVTIAGAQNSGKSTLLNALFNLNFAVSFRVESKGVKGVFTKAGTTLFLILDTEGSNSQADLANEAHLFVTGPAMEAVIVRFLSMVSNIVILNAFAASIAHEVGFAANLRAFFKSFLDRQDLDTAKPLLLIALRDLDAGDRHVELMSDVHERFITVCRDIIEQVAEGENREENLRRLKGIKVELMPLPHPEHHNPRKGRSYPTEEVRVQAAVDYFNITAREKFDNAMNAFPPTPTPWMSPAAHVQAMQDALSSANTLSAVLTNPLVDAQNRKLQVDLDTSLEPVSVKAAIDEIFGRPTDGELWPALVRSSQTKVACHETVTQTIFDQFLHRTGLTVPTPAQTGLRIFLNTCREKIARVTEPPVSLFFERAIRQGEQRLAALFETGNIDVKKFLRALEAQRLVQLDEKLKAACGISNSPMNDLFLAEPTWSAAADWLISDIRSSLEPYNRRDLGICIDVVASAQLFESRVQSGLRQTYGAQGVWLKYVLDHVEAGAASGCIGVQVAGGLGLALGAVTAAPAAALLAVPIGGLAIWKPEIARAANERCQKMAKGCGRSARAVTYMLGAMGGFIKRVPL